MKILILTNNGNGLLGFRRELLARLLQIYETYVCFPFDDSVSKLEDMGCKYVPCELNRRGTNPFSDVKLLLSYRRIVKKIRPEVVLTYTIKPNSYGGIVCSMLDVPYIANVTGLGTSIENGGILQKVSLTLYKHGLKKAEHVFFQNQYNCQFMLNNGVVKGEYSVLPGSGVNLDDNRYEDYPSEENGISFLFVGRIMKDKGISEYLECAKEICERHPECSFSIVGNYDEESYQQLVDEYAKSGIIKYYGYRKDVHAIMSRHHVLIQPSYHEGLSNVLLEAAACGRPVIASDVQGCKETFDEGVSGFGFEVRDSNSLISAVKKMLSLSFEERRQMGISGRRKVEREFNRQIVVDAYLNEINRISESNRKGE